MPSIAKQLARTVIAMRERQNVARRLKTDKAAWARAYRAEREVDAECRRVLAAKEQAYLWDK